MGNNTSSSMQNNVKLEHVQGYINELRENFNYINVFYVSRIGTQEYPKSCILEKTSVYQNVYKCLEHHFVSQTPVIMYIHPSTRQIYRVLNNGSPNDAIDVIHVDGLDAWGNLYVNQSNTMNPSNTPGSGDLIES